MDFALGLVAGFFALPWLWMAFLALIFVVEVVLCENEQFGWGTSLTLGGTALVAWLGADLNVFAWVWANLAAIAKFSLIYFAVGGLWSIVKWYFYLLRVKERLDRFADETKSRKRPNESYAKNNKGRIMGWIAHWPFSMLGTVFGDFLKRVVETVFNVLRNLYDRIANHVFAGFES